MYLEFVKHIPTVAAGIHTVSKQVVPIIVRPLGKSLVYSTADQFFYTLFIARLCYQLGSGTSLIALLCIRVQYCSNLVCSRNTHAHNNLQPGDNNYALTMLLLSSCCVPRYCKALLIGDLTTRCWFCSKVISLVVSSTRQRSINWLLSVTSLLEYDSLVRFHSTIQPFPEHHRETDLSMLALRESLSGACRPRWFSYAPNKRDRTDINVIMSFDGYI